MMPIALPLEGLLVVDFSQFLAGPSASLRMADWGARVIKVERKVGGDASRQLVLAKQRLGQDSLLFHTINRNKESLAADFKDPADLAIVRNLVTQADVLIQSFRPGVMERLGLGYEQTLAGNSRLVYASVSGYGSHGPWRAKPGQDLLVQAVSGLAWLNGRAEDPPTAIGLSIVDTLAGCHLLEGVLACLVRRGISGRGGRVEVSLLESALDFQFEVLTAFLNDGDASPRRSTLAAAHAYIPAPYGIYATADGYLALAMTPVPDLGELIDLPILRNYTSPDSWFDKRDAIKQSIALRLRQKPTRHWLDLLEPAGVWCADVYDWERLVKEEAFQAIDMVQEVGSGECRFRTTRCPVRIDGEVLKSPVAAPRLDQHRPLAGEDT
jgi:crotonobetainyl-CoA:carnitine CoA-transferase CaiB-like acyl-CoA transferase